MQSAKLGPYTVYFDNSEEYHRIKREIWGANGYYEELPDETPTILDIGAHIGLATLYFKKLYPQARIVAVEPVPENALLLKKNIFENQLENVEVYEEAVADHGGEETMYIDAQGKWRSVASVHRGAWTGDQESREITVTCQPLAHYLKAYNPDLVKLDVEGAEERIIVSAKDYLKLAKRYIIEFHPVQGAGMERIVKTLTDQGFTTQVVQGGRVVPWQKAWGLSLIRAWR